MELTVNYLDFEHSDWQKYGTKSLSYGISEKFRKEISKAGFSSFVEFLEYDLHLTQLYQHWIVNQFKSYSISYLISLETTIRTDNIW